MGKDIVADLLHMANAHANGEEAELLNAAASEIDLLRDEKADLSQRLDFLAKETVYKGNSVEWWYCKATAYREALGRCWEALNAGGIYANGDKTVADAITGLCDENARLLQSALASQRDADNLMEKLHAAERERERLRLDVAYLADRASAAGSFGGRTPRDCGTSSNAIVAYAYGGVVPSACYMPCDKSDLAACELAVARMPEHRKTPEVLAALERAKKAVRY